MSSSKFQLSGPVVLELMGHKRLVGHASEETVAGQPFIRMDLPQAEGETLTRLFSPSSVYSITITTEEVVRELAQAQHDAAPVRPWEFRDLRALPAQAERVDEDEEDDEAPGF
jgi:hypothetical protein